MSLLDDNPPFAAAISGRKTLVKPPLSVGMRSGSVTLAPGEEVGEHKTEGREEAIIVLAGTATVICEGKGFEVREKQFMYVPPECVHNVINGTDGPLEYVYVVAPVGGQSMTEHSHDGAAHTH
jgi:mannose-6-phosphate isomerase-like protein (cupin superfamily)